MTTFLLIGIGSALGANIRFLLSTYAARRWGTAFPYGTLMVNISGCFLIGLLLHLLATRFANVSTTSAQLFLATGFLGGYTTFSTFAYETVALSRQRNHRPALLNLIGSSALGIGAVMIGIFVAR